MSNIKEAKSALLHHGKVVWRTTEDSGIAEKGKISNLSYYTTCNLSDVIKQTINVGKKYAGLIKCT